MEEEGPVCNFIEEQTTSLGYDPFGKNTDFSLPLPVQHQQVETFSRRTIFPELERYEYEYNLLCRRRWTHSEELYDYAQE